MVSALTVSGNVIAYNANGGVHCVLEDQGAVPPLLECNDFYGNVPDFVDGACGQVIGANGNFSADPFFGQIAGCPPGTGDYCLEDDSPLLPENSPPGCGLIGALGACLPIGVPGIDSSPHTFSVHAARPNPFAESATIPFELPADSEVLVSIYSARGEAVLVNPPQHQFAGQRSVVWDGRDRLGSRCPPGVYFVRIQSGAREFAARVVLLY